MLVQEPVQAAVWHCLNHYAYTDAQFLAERLYAEVQSEEAALLLATSYYRSGSCGRAYWLLSGRQLRSPLARYLLALCCVQLEQLAEAEAVLLHSRSAPLAAAAAAPAASSSASSANATASLDPAVLRKLRTCGPSQQQTSTAAPGAAAVGAAAAALSHDEIADEFGESAAFVFRLLARIYSGTERKAKAADASRRALKANPFLFDSFAQLCRSGERVDPAKVFSTAGLEQSLTTSGLGVPHQPSAGLHTHHTLSQHHSHSLCPAQQQQQQQAAPAASPSTPSVVPVTSGAATASKYPPPAPPVNFTSTPIQGSLWTGLSEPVKAKQSLFRSIGSVSGASSSHSIGVSPLTPSFGCVPLSTPTVCLTGPSSAVSGGGQSVGGGHCSSLLPLAPLSSPFLPNNTNTELALDTRPAPPRRTLLRKERVLSASAVKENNKLTSRFVTPGSPSRKIKTRSCRVSNTTSSCNSASATTASSVATATMASVAGSVKLELRSCAPAAAAALPSQLTAAASAAEMNEKNRSDCGDAGLTGAATAGVQQLQQATWLVQKQSVDGLMLLLRELGAAYHSLCRFDCERVLEVLETVPPHQFNTGWVLCLAGKAHFELNKYTAAAGLFETVRRLEPYRLDMMEYYSTALWHLQKEVELSALAQDLLEFDRNSQQAWCAAGNCFSLQKEHDTAIKFFSRAVQLSPKFAYAHTLLGHEYVLTEELDRAMNCFRRAVAIEPRHYNAWYGIGMIFYKQERYKLAEMYFKNALDINPQSSVLLCHVGVVQHNLHRSAEALCTLERAMRRDPSNPLCLFHRASINLSCGQLQEALAQLQRLKRLVPKESLVFFLIGKVYEKMGESHQARMHFSWALDLDPKGANNQLKESVDTVISPHTPSPLTKHDGGVAVLGSSSLLTADGGLNSTVSAPAQHETGGLSSSNMITPVGAGLAANDSASASVVGFPVDMDSDDTF